MGRMFGYSRVSTTDQDWSLQLDALIKHGVDERDIFCEKVSGSKRNRIELNRILGLLKNGDCLVVWRLDRLARSQRDLLDIADEVHRKGAELVSIMDKIDTNTATGKMLFGILGALAEFERNLIIERTKSGQAIAKKRGIRFGRPRKLTPELAKQIQTLYNDGGSQVKDICQNLNISKSTFYNALKAAV